MKRLILILLLASLSLNIFGQEKPIIKVLTDTRVIGTGIPNAVLHIKSTTATAVINNTIPNTGIIDFNLTGLVAGGDAVVWQTNAAGDSEKMVVHIDTNLQGITLLGAITTNSTDGEKNAKQFKQKLADDLLLANSKAVYQRTILTTNFNIPIARFDVYKPEYENGSLVSKAKGNVSLFSSIGAGFGVSFGRATVSRNMEGKIIDEEFANTYGLFLGVLYESGTGDNPKNVFAPTLSLAFLDFQIGVGYEYGKIEENQERTFVTISYGIPVYKLFKTNHKVFLDKKGMPLFVEKL